MSVWKSPVFYFGLLLLLVVVALLAAPYVVNWNGYKGNLEAYGRRLTGRNVQIGGDVQIRLFPWPKLTAHNVAIGNPDGIEGAPLIHTDTMTLSLQLGGLLNGNLNVESVELLEPRVTLIRSADGDVNWLLSPDEDLRRSALLSNVRLDQIKLVSGAIRLDDRKQGLVADISTMDADISADAIEGPWRLRGTGYWREMPMAFTFSSGVYSDKEPFRFGIKVTPGDPSLPVFTVDAGGRAVAVGCDDPELLVLLRAALSPCETASATADRRGAPAPVPRARRGRALASPDGKAVRGPSGATKRSIAVPLRCGSGGTGRHRSRSRRRGRLRGRSRSSS